MPKPETPRLNVVKEYVRELIEAEALKTNGERELSDAKTLNERLFLVSPSAWLFFATTVYSVFLPVHFMLFIRLFFSVTLKRRRMIDDTFSRSWC